MRYQAMLQEGLEPQDNITHVRDVFVWSNTIIERVVGSITRVNYYATCIGDDDRILSLSTRIQKLRYSFRDAQIEATGRVHPILFKKPRQAAKSNAVDINLTVDALRHGFSDSVDVIVLVTGDGDFVPLIREIMNRGKEVALHALSHGLHPQLPVLVDEFVCLDGDFFKPTEAPPTKPEPEPAAPVRAEQEPA